MWLLILRMIEMFAMDTRMVSLEPGCYSRRFRSLGLGHVLVRGEWSLLHLLLGFKSWSKHLLA